MRIHATEILGPKQSMTPDGFLLCQDVAIARTGDQRYVPEDGIPVEPGNDGMIRIAREEAEVFRPETMASFEGKPITIDHTFINPENFKEIVVGHVQNVRRGEGLDSDLLIADMLIQDADAIRMVRPTIDSSGKAISPRREVSCGYDADYQQISPGYGRQLNIVGNHVALVERGRAGMRCSIQDEDTIPMSTKTTVKQRLLAMVGSMATKDADVEEAIKSMDERTQEEKDADEEKAKTADSIAKLTKTVDSLITIVTALAKTKDEAGEKDDDKEKKTEDSDEDDEDEGKKAKAAVGDAMAAAEILVPGFKAPTTDSIKTMGSVTDLQRSVLRTLVKTTDGAALLKPLLKNRTVDALSADALAVTFDAAAEMQRLQNNASGFKAPTADSRQGVVTADSINKANAQFWAKK